MFKNEKVGEPKFPAFEDQDEMTEAQIIELEMRGHRRAVGDVGTQQRQVNAN